MFLWLLCLQICRSKGCYLAEKHHLSSPGDTGNVSVLWLHICATTLPFSLGCWSYLPGLKPLMRMPQQSLWGHLPGCHQWRSQGSWEMHVVLGKWMVESSGKSCHPLALRCHTIIPLSDLHTERKQRRNRLYPPAHSQCWSLCHTALPENCGAINFLRNTKHLGICLKFQVLNPAVFGSWSSTMSWFYNRSWSLQPKVYLAWVGKSQNILPSVRWAGISLKWDRDHDFLLQF